MVISRISASVIVENSIFSVDGDTGQFYKINMNDWIIEESFCLDELYFDSFKYSYLYRQDNNIWIVPLHLKKIARYDIINSSFSCIDVFESGQERKFAYVYMYNNDIYMFPNETSSGVLKYSTITGEIERDAQWDEHFKRIGDKKIRMVTSADDQIYLCYLGSSDVSGYGFDKRSFVHNTFEGYGPINSIACKKNEICISGTQGGELLICSFEHDHDFVITKIQSSFSIKRAIYVGNNILFSDCSKLYILKDNQVCDIDPINELENFSTVSSHFLYAYKWKDKYVLPPLHSNMFIVLDSEGKYVTGKAVYTPRSVLTEYVKNTKVISESHEVPIDDFLSVI